MAFKKTTALAIASNEETRYDQPVKCPGSLTKIHEQLLSRNALPISLSLCCDHPRRPRTFHIILLFFRLPDLRGAETGGRNQRSDPQSLSQSARIR